MHSITRRSAIKAAGMLVAGAAMGGLVPAGFAQAQEKGGRKKSLRVAHLTDLHIQPEKKADAGVAACLRHLRTHAEGPEMVLLGGDLVMDSFESDDARTRTQWDLFTKTFKDECAITVAPCLGNHDIWGINKAKSKTKGDEPGWGKRRAMDLLGMSKAYRSFDRGGWHFVVLDSVTPVGDGYIGKLDDTQWEWLEGDLKGTKLPTMIVTHIPILGITQVVSAKRGESKNRELNDGLIMADGPRFVSLFQKNPHVKACLSGHMHEIDRVDYQGVAYLCNGAVSGNWWKGRHKMCDEGYALLDLFDDGSFESTYVKYGWKAQA